MEKLKSIETLTKECAEAFKNKHSTLPTIISAAPGRVNIIGEHTDYNDGFVLPMVSLFMGFEFQVVFSS